MINPNAHSVSSISLEEHLLPFYLFLLLIGLFIARIPGVPRAHSIVVCNVHQKLSPVFVVSASLLAKKMQPLGKGELYMCFLGERRR